MRFSTQRTRRTPAVVSFVFSVTIVIVAATPQAMYLAAMAREQAVRLSMADTEAPATIADVRAVVAAYQEIVRLYPASGYSDNALWQGGRLAIDAFFRFGQERDRNTGIRLLRLLRTEYPTSRKVKDIPDQLARAEGASAGAPKPPAFATIKGVRREVLAD